MTSSTASETPIKTTTADGVTLSWKLIRSPKSLDVWFRVENKSPERIYVCDKLLVFVKNAWRAFPAASVMNSEVAPDAVRIVVGTPPTDVSSLVVTPVMYAPIDAGATFEARLPLGWPLKTYNPMGMQEPINKGVTKAELVVASFRGEPPEWVEIPAEDGGVHRRPEGFTPRDLTGGTLSLP